MDSGAETHNLFLSEQNTVARRYAVLKDDGQTGWLYLTHPDATQPMADVWVFNRVPPPRHEQIRSYAPSPPPAPVGYAGDFGLIEAPLKFRWLFIWSDDGEAVAVAKDGHPIAFILASRKHGFSRNLMRDGRWGMMWSEEAFEKTFDKRSEPQ